MAEESQVSGMPLEVSTETPVVKEVRDVIVIGEYLGQCKWFNDRLGYGFLTVQKGEKKGTDIFVHHSGIKPLNSNYKTLHKAEYVNFNITNGENGLQAVDVTGVDGGALMCDLVPARKTTPNRLPVAPLTVSPAIVPPGGGFKRVSYRKPYQTGKPQ